MNVSEVFLTWNDSRRSQSLSARLDLPRVVHVADRRGAIRHVLGLVQTGLFILRHRPRLVWYQYSQALGILLAIYRQLMPDGRVRLVADLHTKALRRELGGVMGAFFAMTKRHALRSCACTLVTNHQNAAYATERYNIVPLVLPDPLPTVPPVSSSGAPGPVVFVCSFAEDEPLELMLQASDRLRPLPVVVTGDARKLPPDLRERFSRVARLSGFLPETEYWSLLHRARCIVVLSSEQACLPCGAYEAIAAGCAPIVADDHETRHVFGNAARYSELSVEGLVSTIQRTVAETRAASQASAFKDRWNQAWRAVSCELAAHRSLPEVVPLTLEAQHAGS